MGGEFLETQPQVEKMQMRDDLKFLKDCSPRRSGYVSSIARKELSTGLNDTRESVGKALKRAAGNGLPSQQIDAQHVMDTHRRPGVMVIEHLITMRLRPASPLAKASTS